MTLAEMVKMIKKEGDVNLVVEYGGVRGELTVDALAGLKDKTVQEILVTEVLGKVGPTIILKAKDEVLIPNPYLVGCACKS